MWRCTRSWVFDYRAYLQIQPSPRQSAHVRNAPWAIGKHPTSNIQAPEKLQAPSANSRACTQRLELGASLDVGAWCLVLLCGLLDASPTATGQAVSDKIADRNSSRLDLRTGTACRASSSSAA